jgi:hypothetical protein
MQSFRKDENSSSIVKSHILNDECFIFILSVTFYVVGSVYNDAALRVPNFMNLISK